MATSTDRAEMLRDKNGHAKMYATPERAEVDAEQLRRTHPDLCVWIRWLPIPRRPWRVCFEENHGNVA